MDEKTRSWRRKYVVEFWTTILGLVAMNLIFIAGAFRQEYSIRAEGAGQLGDFVGGYVGTGFVLLSVVLLYRTLRNQRETSQRQFFESRFFELIKLHRDNVAEMQLQETEGRRVFLKLLKEYRAITEVVRDVTRTRGTSLGWRDSLQISYYCLFYGTGPDSSRMLRIALAKLDQGLVAEIDDRLRSQSLRDHIRKSLELGYEPFEGHQSRLGHYYRHLYQAVRYVDAQVLDIEKYEYVKTLRAQLTTHEQALLLINSLTPIGGNWWKYDLMLKYRMVKNMPRHFLDPLEEIDPSSLFPKNYFEWEEADAG